jgi:hypothetical protein
MRTLTACLGPSKENTQGVGFLNSKDHSQGEWRGTHGGGAGSSDQVLHIAVRLDFRYLNRSEIRRAFLVRGRRRGAERRLAEAATMLIAAWPVFSSELQNGSRRCLTEAGTTSVVCMSRVVVGCNVLGRCHHCAVMPDVQREHCHWHCLDPYNDGDEQKSRNGLLQHLV